MKKIITSKKFIAGALAVLCVGILVVCLVVSSDKKDEFVPDPSPTGTLVDSWEENPSSSPNGSGYPGSQGKVDEEQYPKVVEENEDEVVIDFTDPSPSKEVSAPETPGTDADHVDHDAVPVQTPSEGGKPQNESSGSNTPAPGSTNDKGQVYDAAFGWITPAEVIQESIDSDGDPNKMVGEMD